MSDEYETCEIVIVTIKDSGLFSFRGGEHAFKAEKITSQGRTHLMQSGTFRAIYYKQWIDGSKSRFREITQLLIAQGWEPVGDFPRVKVKSDSDYQEFESAILRRKIENKPSSDTKPSGNTSDDALLQAAWLLRKENMLTSEEFEAVMSRLQNRD